MLKFNTNCGSWDELYDRELRNHADDGDDEGTVWFDESNAERVVLKQLDKLVYAGLLARGHGTEESEAAVQPSRFLDLGTGNGHMLFELREEDSEGKRWCGEMIGVDYSEASVQLARRIATQKVSGDNAAFQQIRFECWDLLSSPPGDWLADGFDVVLDKGTFDAISLMEQLGGSPHPCETYRDKVTSLMKPGSFLFVTSCNWTKDELVGWLVNGRGELIIFDEAKYPTFQFGGRTGQSVVTVIFQRRGG